MTNKYTRRFLTPYTTTYLLYITLRRMTVVLQPIAFGFIDHKMFQQARLARLSIQNECRTLCPHK